MISAKKIEENNSMGKTRDLFKKIRDTKGTFHAKMGSIKDRNGMDLKKQKILRRGGKNTQKRSWVVQRGRHSLWEAAVIRVQLGGRGLDRSKPRAQCHTEPRPP